MARSDIEIFPYALLVLTDIVNLRFLSSIVSHFAAICKQFEILFGDFIVSEAFPERFFPIFTAFYVSAEIFLIFLRFCTRFLLPFFSFRDILFMLVLRRERFFAVCRRITYGFFPIKRA